MYTIGQLAGQFQLSRTTLLYYDSIGLLQASARTESQYRLYSEKDKQRLEQICHYRQLGVSLKEIKQLLSQSGKNDVTNILEKHLIKLGEKIRILKEQQLTIVQILQDDQLLQEPGMIDKNKWVKILQGAGLDDNGMSKWHQEFEKMAPEAHEQFLVSLGIEKNEIRRIRKAAVKKL